MKPKIQEVEPRTCDCRFSLKYFYMNEHSDPIETFHACHFKCKEHAHLDDKSAVHAALDKMRSINANVLNKPIHILETPIRMMYLGLTSCLQSIATIYTDLFILLCKIGTIKEFAKLQPKERTLAITYAWAIVDQTYSAISLMKNILKNSQEIRANSAIVQTLEEYCNKYNESISLTRNFMDHLYSNYSRANHVSQKVISVHGILSFVSRLEHQDQDEVEFFRACIIGGAQLAHRSDIEILKYIPSKILRPYSNHAPVYYVVLSSIGKDLKSYHVVIDQLFIDSWRIERILHSNVALPGTTDIATIAYCFKPQ
jgi:hypothetical protein